jgi:hypothetical protein
MNATTALFNASTAPAGPPAVASPGGLSATSGGLLRPGSIDQGAFLQQLQAQQAARSAAGVGGRPVGMPVPAFQDGIPTLSSAQFAALVGAQAQAQGDDPGDAPAMMPARLRPAAATPPAALPAATAVKLSGLRLAPAANLAAADPPNAAVAAGPEGEDAPIISRTASGTPIADPVANPVANPVEGAVKPQSAQDIDRKNAAAAAANTDPRVVHLKDPPDKEMQKTLRTEGKRWVVDETPGARQLFFGDDGVFGWDDFLDLINPLQHIPIVAQIYRAISGDQINGAAELLGAIPFGPLGGLGMMGAIADLAVKDVTGKDIGDNLQAMIFGGPGNTGSPPGTTPANMAAVPGDPAAGTQLASSSVAYDTSAASERHADCRG